MEYTAEQIQHNRRGWITDLRSGNYTQANGCLVRVDDEGNRSYCCLGVPCASLQLNAEATTLPGIVRYMTASAGRPLRSEGAVLTNEVADAMGLAAVSPAALWHGRWVELTSLNDTFEFTLLEIATVIEAQADTWDGCAPVRSLYWDPDENNIPHPNIPHPTDPVA